MGDGVISMVLACAIALFFLDDFDFLPLFGHLLFFALGTFVCLNTSTYPCNWREG